MYAVGDIAAITDAKTKTVLPQLGSVALQSGEHAGETIARPIAGKATKPFKYRDKGTMATVGRGAAVLQMMGGRSVGTLHLAPAADQRGPGGSGRRLGGRRDDPPARRPDHGRDGRGARPGRSR
jgi:NADPH-dependent 2,4-dienoyl-CoA reductase/sulfur reductase-like enzyme